MSQAPSMPLFCDAYLADTMHLTLEEHGAYLKLLMLTWRNNGQPLVDDDARLARMVGVTVSRWKKTLRPVLVNFFDLSGGTWFQKRLQKEWDFSIKNIAQKRAAINARWNRNPLKDNETGDTAVSQPYIPPSPSPVEEREETPCSAPPSPLDAPACAVADGQPEPAGEKSKRGKDRGERLPAGAMLPDDWRTWAESEGARDAPALWAEFVDYWAALPGARGLKLDWEATWRNNVRRTLQRSGGPRAGPKSGQGGGMFSAAMNVANRIREWENGIGNRTAAGGLGGVGADHPG